MQKNVVCVRKGAWTKEEDILLTKCIEKYGEGRWHLVPLRAGVNRCRKSCRLRWLNYLSPNIKRGSFARDEVDLIVRLHKLLGNRWSLIAGRIPGRTANDVKNFWNTHVNKKPSPPATCPGEGGSRNETINIIRPRPWVFTARILQAPPPPCPLELITPDTNQDDDHQSSTTVPQNVDSKNMQSLVDDDDQLVPKEDECRRWWSSLLDINKNKNGSEVPVLFPGDESPHPNMISPGSHNHGKNIDDGGLNDIDPDADFWELFSSMDNNS